MGGGGGGMGILGCIGCGPAARNAGGGGPPVSGKTSASLAFNRPPTSRPRIKTHKSFFAGGLEVRGSPAWYASDGRADGVEAARSREDAVAAARSRRRHRRDPYSRTRHNGWLKIEKETTHVIVC